jgi:hypothetical protein
VRTALEGLFRVLFSCLSRSDATAVQRRFCQRFKSRSPVLVDLQPDFARFIETAFTGAKRATVTALTGLDETMRDLIASLSTEPRRVVAPDCWLNPNARVVRSPLPLDTIWAAVAAGQRPRVRRRLTIRDYAVVVVPSGFRVVLLTPGELAVIRGRATTPTQKALASLRSKALVLT